MLNHSQLRASESLLGELSFPSLSFHRAFPAMVLCIGPWRHDRPNP